MVDLILDLLHSAPKSCIVRRMDAIGTMQAIDWATTEFGHAALGDVRRTRRLVSIGSAVLM